MSSIFAFQTKGLNFSKVLFDYSLAMILVIIFVVPMMLMWLVATLETGQNGLFLHQRIGKHAQRFRMFKIRTLKGNYDNPITTETTHKITGSGRFFIKYKLDELPQLFNILNGTMSFVGPRPDVPGYADQLTGEDRIILTIKPGITGPAQLKYRNENDLLKQANDPKQLNDEVLWPDKVAINKKYVHNWSFFGDIKILWETIF
ncbi:MAG: sugar transferase [Flavobacteriaceae bacterium]|nr:sugar transferase [Flavobacteriaceae bacterium]